MSHWGPSSAGAFHSLHLQDIHEGIAPTIGLNLPGQVFGEMLILRLSPDTVLPALRGLSSVQPSASGPLKIACLRYV